MSHPCWIARQSLRSFERKSGAGGGICSRVFVAGVAAPGIIDEGRDGVGGGVVTGGGAGEAAGSSIGAGATARSVAGVTGGGGAAAGAGRSAGLGAGGAA